jgi:hypothetical protein
MPRQKSENVAQICFKIPSEWVDRCNDLAHALTSFDVSATAVMRCALGLGIEELERLEHKEHPTLLPRKRKAKKAK